jgi:hypothetical protein
LIFFHPESDFKPKQTRPWSCIERSPSARIRHLRSSLPSLVFTKFWPSLNVCSTGDSTAWGGVCVCVRVWLHCVCVLLCWVLSLAYSAGQPVIGVCGGGHVQIPVCSHAVASSHGPPSPFDMKTLIYVFFTHRSIELMQTFSRDCGAHVQSPLSV